MSAICGAHKTLPKSSSVVREFDYWYCAVLGATRTAKRSKTQQGFLILEGYDFEWSDVIMTAANVEIPRWPHRSTQRPSTRLIRPEVCIVTDADTDRAINGE